MRLCLVVVLHLFMVFLFVGNEMLDGQYSKCLNHVGIRHDRNLVEDVIFFLFFTSQSLILEMRMSSPLI